MGTSPVKKIASLGKMFIKSGKITAVRRWNGGNIHEIDLHLPNVPFENWDKAQSIKTRITAWHYTEYTPALWNAAEKHCTLYIDTSHPGKGSNWAKHQAAGNDFYYSRTEAGNHFSAGCRHLVFLGDQTGIGHFCALQQLALNSTPINGFIRFNDLKTAEAFSENCPWLPLQAVSGDDAICQLTEDWIIHHEAEKEQYSFFIVGGAGLIVQLRKLLKTYKVAGNQIKSKGFWH